MVSTWLTLAPVDIAILTATESCPLNFPTTRSRIGDLPRYTPALSRRVAVLDDFRHGHAQALVDDDDLAASDQTVVDVDVDGLADLAIELQHRTGAQLQQLRHRQAGAAQDRGDVDRDVEDGRQVGGGLLLVEGRLRQTRAGIELLQLQAVGGGGGDGLRLLLFGFVSHGRPRWR